MDFLTLRQEYRSQQLDESCVNDNPITQFKQWLRQAVDAGITEANAMALATASAAAQPSVRMVLLKGCDENGFVFFTNYTSNKGRQLEENPHAEAVFYWRELERQVRIHGRVTRVSAAESDEYFTSRPLGARIGASVSPQSQPLASRQSLEERFLAVEVQYPAGDVPRPEHWGGYRIEPLKIEFWQGRPSRLHDRIQFVREAGNGVWRKQRLAP